MCVAKIEIIFSVQYCNHINDGVLAVLRMYQEQYQSQ